MPVGAANVPVNSGCCCGSVGDSLVSSFTQQYTGAPRKVGPNTLQKERGLLKRMEVTPTIQNLKTMSLEDRLKYPAPPTMAPEAISLADQIYESNRVSYSTQESGPSIS